MLHFNGYSVKMCVVQKKEEKIPCNTWEQKKLKNNGDIYNQLFQGGAGKELLRE